MAYIYDIADTWSGGGAFTGIKLNVSDGGSTAGSLLMDLQVGAASRFSVRKDGTVAVGTALFAKQTASDYLEATTGWSVGAGTNSGATMTPGIGFVVGPVASYSFANANGISTVDLVLRRDAANTLAQRNGVNAQAFNLYNTYTDASNYERGFMRWVGGVLQIGTEAAGTGAGRLLEIKSAIQLDFYSASTHRNVRFASGTIVLYSPVIQMPNIPIANPAVAGQLWNDAGTLKVSAG